MPQIDINARLNEVRARIDGLRPNLLPQLTGMVRNGRQGGVVARVKAIAMARPMLGQVMRGTLASGGTPTDATAIVEMRESGFRADTAVPTSTLDGGSGYRRTT